MPYKEHRFLKTAWFPPIHLPSKWVRPMVRGFIPYASTPRTGMTGLREALHGVLARC
jgi:hypothetical protein